MHTQVGFESAPVLHSLFEMGREFEVPIPPLPAQSISEVPLTATTSGMVNAKVASPDEESAIPGHQR